MAKKIYILIMLNCFFICNSQTKSDKELAQKILNGVQEKYEKAKSFDYLIEFKMFRGEKSVKTHKQYSGRIARGDNSTYYKAAESETLLSKGYYIRASHEQKLIEYNKSNTIAKSPLEVSQYLQYFKTAQVQDKGSYWICTLSVGKFTSLEYNKIELYIKKDYTLSKQVILFLKKIPFKNEKGIEEFDYPRLEVTLTGNPAKQDEKLFDISKYIAISGNKVSPSGKLRKYKIIDLTKN